MATALVNATDAKVAAFVNRLFFNTKFIRMRAFSTSTNTNSSKFETKKKKEKKKMANSQGRCIRETELGLMRRGF